MERKIAILRGINVGGKRKILMKDLKIMFQELGFTGVTTYIQSGNVIFDSKADNATLALLIEETIHSKLGFEVPVIVIKSEELEKSITLNPFYSDEADISTLHLTFLKEKPEEENIEELQLIDSGSDKFYISDKNVFIYCEGKYHQSKLTNNFFEKKLKVGATTRNWKTVLKLIELSKN